MDSAQSRLLAATGAVARCFVPVFAHAVTPVRPAAVHAQDDAEMTSAPEDGEDQETTDEEEEPTEESSADDSETPAQERVLPTMRGTGPIYECGDVSAASCQPSKSISVMPTPMYSPCLPSSSLVPP